MANKITVKAATEIMGSLGFPSKMPGTSYGIPATACNVGRKLHAVPDTVCSDCYALKANYKYPSVIVAQERRLALPAQDALNPGLIAKRFPIMAAVI